MSNTPYVDIPLGPYMPDLLGQAAPQFPGYLTLAENVLPSPVGYRPVSILSNLGSTAVAGAELGRIFAVNVGGTVNVFASSASTGPTNTRIQQTDDGGDTWSDIEGASGAPGLWPDVCVFDDFVIFASRARVPQEKSVFDTTATVLGNLAGSPPTGATIARVRNHVIIGNLTSASLDKYAVRWGAIGNPEDWPTPGTADARSKQAGIQYFPVEYGEVTKIVGGEKFGLVFQQRAITRMTYVGGSAVFEFDLISQGIGAAAPDVDAADSVIIPPSVVSAGNLFYWPNPQNTGGFFVSDGYTIRRLSSGRTDGQFGGLNTFAAGAFDPVTQTVFFARLVSWAYNIPTDRFSYIDESTDIQSICNDPTSSIIAELEKPRIISLATSGKLQTPSSNTKETISLQTGYIELDPGYNFQIQGAHLLGTATSGLTLSAKTVSTASDCTDSTTGFTSMTSATLGQKKTARLAGQYVAFKISGAGSASQLIHGIRVYYTRSQPAT